MSGFGDGHVNYHSSATSHPFNDACHAIFYSTSVSSPCLPMLLRKLPRLLSLPSKQGHRDVPKLAGPLLQHLPRVITRLSSRVSAHRVSGSVVTGSSALVLLP